VTSGEDPLEAGLEASSQLSEGLRLCHAVVSNYRAILADGPITPSCSIVANDLAPAGDEPRHDPSPLQP